MLWMLAIASITVELPGDTLGRVIVVVATNDAKEPRQQVNDSVDTAQIFGVDVETPQRQVVIDDKVLGYPLAKLSQLPEREYWVQAVFNVYEWHMPADGRKLLLPPDQGEGQHW